MIARILIAVLWGIPCLAQFDEGPYEHMPREYAKSGPWTLVTGPFTNRLYLKMEDNSGVSVLVDTLSPPGSPWMCRFVGGVLPVDANVGEFLVATTSYEDSTQTVWVFNAKDREFREVFTSRDGFGTIVVGCGSTRILLSRGQYAFGGRQVHATTLLVDLNSGAIVREWRGLDIRTGGAYRYPRYDEKTEAFWIFPAFPVRESPSTLCLPKHMIRLECVTGDTVVVREEELFGEDLGEYWVPDSHEGCLLVSAYAKQAGQEDGRIRVMRRLLVDVVDNQVLGEWDWSFRNVIDGTERITEDCSGILYSERDSTGTVKRRLLSVGQPEPIEVDWQGKRGP